MNLYSHPENPQCTKAYMQVVAGDRNKAIKTLTDIGYTGVLAQVEMIEGFIRFQKAFKNKAKRRHSDVGK